ncbi:MAG: hypothetical protein RLZ98_2490 [Pseudomonadota bacterium]|jgi:CRP/FNR family transcriptional regulator
MASGLKQIPGGVRQDGWRGAKQKAAPWTPARVSAAHFAKGEILFDAGERKAHFYRVEAGTVGITWTSPDGDPETIELVGPGEVFGTGLFDEHTCGAVSLTETMVSCWPLDNFFLLADHAPTASQRRAEETEREFYQRRAVCTATSPKEPHQKLAGFLIAVSRMNAREQRDPLRIDEAIHSDAVAGLLHIDIETLGKALVELKKLGGIQECASNGLYIRNPFLLERIARDVPRASRPATQTS